MTRRDDEQFDRYLEGTLPLEALPEDERTEELRLHEVLGTLRHDVRAPTGFRADVMRAVELEASPLWKRIAEWWLVPQSVRIRPAAGALAFAAALAALLLVRPGSNPAGDEPVAASAPAQVVTRFVLVAPEAASVHLTGDFVSWSPEGIALDDLRGTGIWTADVVLPPGVYQYTFVVNGTDWVPDPRAVSQVDDGFGQTNSVVIVPGTGDA
jgi:hypothetical protein